MKNLLLTILVFAALVISSSLFAAPVDSLKAKKIAENFLLIEKNKAKVKLNLASTSQSLSNSFRKSTNTTSQLLNNSVRKSTNSTNNLCYYIFNVNSNDGFIIIAADDKIMPILGYSTSGSFSPSDLPPAFTELLEKYEQEISYIVSNNLQAEPEIDEQWQNLATGQPMSSTKSATSVSPLLSTAWNQGCNYNALCPADPAGPCGHVWAGCVATAMAQIMKYWNYPTQGTGHLLFHSSYGNLNVNFGNTTYDWTNMPNSLSSSSTAAEISAVATLMYHCGVSVKMNYGPSGSGAYTLATNPYSACSENAFQTYFGYKSSIEGYYRSNFTDSAWIQLLKNDLDMGHPIQYVGYMPAGGHSFVFDGYDAYDYFHVNWGWGGSSNGYYTIDALGPGSLQFNNYQQALVGIEPDQVSCETPSGLYATSILETSATLNWNVVLGAQSYNIQYRESSASTWTNSTSTTNSITIGGLSPNTSYDFQVQSVCSSSTSSFSAIATFTTIPSCTPPSSQAVNFSATSISDNGMTISFTRGTGDQVLVVARVAGQSLANPVNSVSYLANSNYGSGGQTGTGNYVVYNGPGASVAITGLNNGTTYEFAIYEYTASSNCYLLPGLTGSETTTIILACGLQEFNGGTTEPAGWSFSGINNTYTTSGNYGNNAPSLQFDVVGDEVVTANVVSPLSLSFWIKGISTNKKSAFKVEGYTGTSWTTIATLTKISTSGTTKTYNNVSAYSKFRFTFTKGPGQLAFDDVNISCGSGSSFAMDPFEPLTEDQRSELLIYPNPGTGLYTIEGSGFEDGTGKIYAFDLLGRNILTKEISVEENSLHTSIDISNFKNGVYSIRVESGSQTVVKRIIKK